ncbi:hypothetical protein [Variovorax sp. N23]|uniref:hypothetical protein n=1 Tax=Variovorax sp. N23 TaxID=2980555 RepID=UPI0021CAD313|nr:hypothetical protein [Variovorax sp. N23]MCU4119345.1 hypothetical protein [Variovorax sp. N23]
MSAATHTPGPWPIERRQTSITAIGPCVADEYAGSAWLDVSEADAQLIAAAPDLLAACQQFMYSVPHTEIHGEPGSLLEVMRTAIAKATGAAEREA